LQSPPKPDRGRVLAGALLLLLLVPALAFAAPKRLEAPSGAEIAIEVFPGQGGATMLWLPSERGFGEAQREHAESLARLGHEVWLVDLHDNYLVPPGRSSIEHFQDEYDAHTKEKRCPALSCVDLIKYYILPDKCQGCGICLRSCPTEAIAGDKRMVHVIDQEKCIKCGTCLNVCPKPFSAVVKVSGKKIRVPKKPVPITAKKVSRKRK